MLETFWYFLFIVAIILMIIIAYMEYEHEVHGDFPIHWLLMFTLLVTIIWFLLASSAFELEQPYQVYNVTSEQVETGIHTITSKTSPEVSMFCNMMAAVMMFYGAYAFLCTFRELYRKD